MGYAIPCNINRILQQECYMYRIYYIQFYRERLSMLYYMRRILLNGIKSWRESEYDIEDLRIIPWWNFN